MVVANHTLLCEVRRLAIRDELLAMRLRGQLVVPEAARGDLPGTAHPERPPTGPHRPDRHRPR